MNKTELKTNLESALEDLRQEFNQIRTGRISPAVLENIKVEMYESQMSIRELATVSVPEPTILVITPWDKSAIESIAAAIKKSDLQIEPIVEGDRIRLSFPGLTEERRKEYAKMVSEKAEESRQKIRRLRQEAMKHIDTMFEEKEISEDEKFSMREDIEDIIKEYNRKVEELADKKTKEIMTV